VNVNVLRDGRAHEFTAEERAFIDQPRIDDAIPQNELIVINIFEEEIQGRQPLDQTLLDAIPFLGGNNSRHRIHGPNPLDALLLSIHGEADAVLKHGQIGHGFSSTKFVEAQSGKTAVKHLVVRARPANLIKHLVKGFTTPVASKQTVQVVIIDRAKCTHDFHNRRD